ncbi:hypothetical protein D3C81_1477800 [compost metagenome]
MFCLLVEWQCSDFAESIYSYLIVAAVRRTDYCRIDLAVLQVHHCILYSFHPGGAARGHRFGYPLQVKKAGDRSGQAMIMHQSAAINRHFSEFIRR